MDFGMIEDLLHDEQTPPTDIKVFGVGGGGGNAINRMIESGLKKVVFVALNTDIQALQRSKAEIRLPIGKETTGGLGAGGKPEIGQKSAEESKEEIRRLLKGTDMVFITAGMGGGTGTGAAPVVAEIAKSEGILTIAVVTTPFSFEGPKKMKLAKDGIDKLRKNVDTLILIPNQYLIKVAEATMPNMPIRQAFLMADDVLRQGVQGISELITEPGEINIDFADVSTVMRGKGDAIMGIGIGEGPNRAVDAARQAINNPLLENEKIDGAKNILVNITGGDLSLNEFRDVNEMIQSYCDPDALLIVGMAYNQDLGDKVKVTVIATGVNHQAPETSYSGAPFSMNRHFADQQGSAGNAYSSSYEPRESSYEGASQKERIQAEVVNDSNVEGAIQKNRWQDLYQKVSNLRNSHGDNGSGDPSTPAAFRYNNDM